MKVQFKEYLHEENEELEEDLRSWLPSDYYASLSQEDIEDLCQKIGSPFYEVTVTCELDTETGEVTLLEAKL